VPARTFGQRKASPFALLLDPPAPVLSSAAVSSAPQAADARVGPEREYDKMSPRFAGLDRRRSASSSSPVRRDRPR
jgi:hypothetical protein